MNLIKCPYCKQTGLHRNLAEILPNGDIKISRFQEVFDIFGDKIKEIEYTIVRSSEFQLICGTCQNIVVYKKPIIPLPQVNIMMTWGTMVQYYEKNI